MAAALSKTIHGPPGARCSPTLRPQGRLQPRGATHLRFRRRPQPVTAQSDAGASVQPYESLQPDTAAVQAAAAAPAAAPPAAAAPQLQSKQQRLAEVLRFCLPVVLVPLVSKLCAVCSNAVNVGMMHTAMHTVRPHPAAHPQRSDLAGRSDHEPHRHHLPGPHGHIPGAGGAGARLPAAHIQVRLLVAACICHDTWCDVHLPLLSAPTCCC